MIINKSGIMIRMAVSNLRVMGRATQGVRLIKLNDEDEIAAVTKVESEKDEEEQIPDILEDDKNQTDNQSDGQE
jgi:DNA gyrase subunit A